VYIVNLEMFAASNVDDVPVASPPPSKLESIFDMAEFTAVTQGKMKDDDMKENTIQFKIKEAPVTFSLPLT
jgi:hypothetical protein